MAKTNAGHFFEDFEAGQVLQHAVPRTVTEGDQALYVALTGDRSIVHASAEVARKLGHRREPVHDLLVFHVVFGKTVNDISLNAVANLGYADVRFVRPVYPGDTLAATSTVLGKKENSSGKNGVVWVKTVGTNQRGEEVLSYFRWVMVHKRDHSTRTGAADRPALPPEVKASDLVAPPGLRFDRLPKDAGGRFRLGDYEVGERIDHVDGMTIEESEHAMATRLYQNTAKVHFDAHHMAGSRFGRRLMYGGHVISVCRALAFNGLENVTQILAWNGGAHANPTFAGDTLYAQSEILERTELRDDCGALRVRLVGFKNCRPGEVPLKVERGGKQRYHDNVVLDLDWWLLLPR